jgi:hypothetical protein
MDEWAKSRTEEGAYQLVLDGAAGLLELLGEPVAVGALEVGVLVKREPSATVELVLGTGGDALHAPQAKKISHEIRDRFLGEIGCGDGREASCVYKGGEEGALTLSASPFLGFFAFFLSLGSPSTLTPLLSTTHLIDFMVLLVWFLISTACVHMRSRRERSD